MDEVIRLEVYQAIAEVKEQFENPSLATDQIVQSVLDAIDEVNGQYFERDGTPIRNLAGFAAQRAEWRLIDRERIRLKHGGAYRADQAAQANDYVRHATIARGTLPSNTSDESAKKQAALFRKLIKELEAGECHEKLGVLVRQAQRIGKVLRMVLLEKKSYEVVHKSLGIAKGTVASDVVLGKRYLRTIARKVER
jgi:hypothetical protein